MLYARGIASMQRYAGTASVKSSKSTLIIEDTIKKPTKINAGAVAKPGTAVKIGAKKIATRNSIPVTTDASPVLAPAPTPAELSTKVVVVEVPKIAPAQVAIASASKAGLIFGSFSPHQAFPLSLQRLREFQWYQTYQQKEMQS